MMGGYRSVASGLVARGLEFGAELKPGKKIEVDVPTWAVVMLFTTTVAFLFTYSAVGLFPPRYRS
jgi:hypothetical protein